MLKLFHAIFNLYFFYLHNVKILIFIKLITAYFITFSNIHFY